jgi:monomeric isocitrate dehydrogenase
MNQFPFLCEHTCRNTCSALTRALQFETALVRLSEEVIQQCDDADIKEFMRDLARNSSESVIRIMQKMNEVQARTQILDGIANSFEPHTTNPPKPH